MSVVVTKRRCLHRTYRAREWNSKSCITRVLKSERCDATIPIMIPCMNIYFHNIGKLPAASLILPLSCEQLIIIPDIRRNMQIPRLWLLWMIARNAYAIKIQLCSHSSIVISPCLLCAELSWNAIPHFTHNACFPANVLCWECGNCSQGEFFLSSQPSEKTNNHSHMYVLCLCVHAHCCSNTAHLFAQPSVVPMMMVVTTDRMCAGLGAFGHPWLTFAQRTRC